MGFVAQFIIDVSTWKMLGKDYIQNQVVRSGSYMISHTFLSLTFPNCSQKWAIGGLDESRVALPKVAVRALKF